MARLVSRASKRVSEIVTMLLQDYKRTLIEVKDEIIARPIKSSLQLSSVAGVIYLIKKNPDESCLHDQLVTARNDLICVTDSIRNPLSFEHVSFLNQCQGERTLKRIDLGIISFLFRLDLDPECALYINQCQYLKPSYLEYMKERLVDIGIAGRWRILDYKMVDYDINPNEWS